MKLNGISESLGERIQVYAMSVWDCRATLIQTPSQDNKQPLEVKKFRVSVGMRQQQKKHNFISIRKCACS